MAKFQLYGNAPASGSTSTKTKKLQLFSEPAPAPVDVKEPSPYANVTKGRAMSQTRTEDAESTQSFINAPALDQATFKAQRAAKTKKYLFDLGAYNTESNAGKTSGFIPATVPAPQIKYDPLPTAQQKTGKMVLYRVNKKSAQEIADELGVGEKYASTEYGAGTNEDIKKFVNDLYKRTKGVNVEQDRDYQWSKDSIAKGVPWYSAAAGRFTKGNLKASVEASMGTAVGLGGLVTPNQKLTAGLPDIVTKQNTQDIRDSLLTQSKALFDRSAASAESVGTNDSRINKIVGGAIQSAPDLLLSLGIEGLLKTGVTAGVKYTVKQVAKGLLNRQTQKEMLLLVGKAALHAAVPSLSVVPMELKSFVSTYHDAMSKGADENGAVAAAFVSSWIEGAIEKGGIQFAVRNAKSGFMAWFKSTIGEGGEEFWQDMLAPAAEKYIAGISDIKDFSWNENADSIINPKRALTAAASGSLMGGVMGLPLLRGGNIPGMPQSEEPDPITALSDQVKALSTPEAVQSFRQQKQVEDQAKLQQAVETLRTPPMDMPQPERAAKPVIDSYHLRTASGEFVPIKGKEVILEGHENLPTAIYRDKSKQFVVVEARSGVRISYGATPNLAKQNAAGTLDNMVEDGIDPDQAYGDIAQASPSPGYVEGNNANNVTGELLTDTTGRTGDPLAQGVAYNDTGVGFEATEDMSYTPEVHDALAIVNRSAVEQGVAKESLKAVLPVGSAERNIVTLYKKAFGVTVAIVEGAEGATGITESSHPNIIFVNRGTPLTMNFVAGHELGHTLKWNYPESYQKILDIAEGMVDDKTIQKYSDQVLHKGSTIKGEREAILEELVNDQLGTMMTDKTFWERVALQGREFFDQIVKLARDIIGKLQKADVGSYLNQRTIKALNAELETMVKDVMDIKQWTEKPVDSTNKQDHNGTEVSQNGEVLVGDNGRQEASGTRQRDEGTGSNGRADRRGNHSVLLTTGATATGNVFQVNGNDVLETTDANAFYDCISLAKSKSTHSAFVDLHTISEYSQKTLFLMDNGRAGVAISSDGDIVSVFKNTDCKIPGVSHTLLMAAFQNGGTKLDCYDSPAHFLPDLYANHGFIPVVRLKFDREYADSKWNYERDGEPDLYFFRHPGSYDENATYPRFSSYDNIPYVESYDEGISARDNSMSSPDVKFMNRTEGNAPIFYSQMERTISGIKQDRMGASTVVQYLFANKTKAEEIKWSGIEEFLSDKKSVTKQELLDFARASDLGIKDVVKNNDRKTLDAAYSKVLDEKVVAYEALRKKGVNNSMAYSILDALEKDEELTDEQFSVLTKAFPPNDSTAYNINNYTDAISAHDAEYAIAKVSDPPKFGGYTLPGATNYREVLFTLPDDQGSYMDKMRSKYGKNLTQDELSDHMTDKEWDEYKKRDHIGGSIKSYKGAHWDEANVLAHTRLNDRVDAEGNKVLFVEEIQSDWNQEGRKKGYQLPPITEKDIDLKYIPPTVPEGGDPSLYPGYWESRDKRTGNLITRMNGYMTEFRAMEESKDWFPLQNDRKVPLSPYSKTWQEYTFKRILRMAAEGGYAKVGWTTGEQQAARYDLSKQVDSIETMVNPTTKTYDLRIMKDGRTVQNLENTKESDLDALVGKDLATKIIEDSKQTVTVFHDLNEPLQGKTYSGLDLKVGGEGMSGFYDRMLVKFANEYLKSWGVRVKKEIIGEDMTKTSAYRKGGMDEVKRIFSTLPAERKNNLIDVWTVEVTPAMSRSVLTDGQVKFTARKAAIEEAFKDSKVRNADGSLMEVYHGTSNKKFTEFTGFIPNFFTPDKQYAENYTTKGGPRGRVITAYLNITNPFNTEDPNALKLYNEKFIPERLAKTGETDRYKLLNKGEMVPFTTVDALYPFLRRELRNGLASYDGIVADEGGFSDKNIYVPLFNTQIKSPYSDNSVDLKNPDIRFTTQDFDENKFPKSVMNNENMAEEIKAMIDKTAKEHRVAHNAASVVEAARLIVEDRSAAYQRGKSSRETGPIAAALRFYFMSEALQRKDWNEAFDWVDVLNNSAVEAGQSVQIYSILKRLTPEGAIVFADRQIKKTVSESHNKRIDREKGEAKTTMDNINSDHVDPIAGATKNKLDEILGNPSPLQDELDAQKADQDAKASDKLKREAEAHLKRALKRAEDAKTKADIAKAKADVGVAEASLRQATEMARKQAETARLKKAQSLAKKAERDADRIAGKADAKEKEKSTPEQMLADRVKSWVKPQNGKDELDPVAVMVKTLFDLAKKQLPEHVATAKNDPFKVIADAVNNVEEFRRVWDASKIIVASTFADKPKALQELDAWFAEYMTKPFTEGQLKTVVGAGIKSADIDISKLVREHYTVIDQAGQSLLDKIREQTGLSGIESAYLDWFIRTEFQKRTNAAKESILKQRFAAAKGPVERANFVERIIELSNLGAVSSSQYAPLLAQRLGIPALTPELALTIQTLAEQIQLIDDSTAVGARSKDVLSALMMKEIQKSLGHRWHDPILNALNLTQTFAMLSSPTSAIRNIVGNSMFGGIDLTKDYLAVVLDRAMSLYTKEATVPVPELMAKARGWKKGAIEGSEDLRLGIDTSMQNTMYELSKSMVWDSGLGKFMSNYLNATLRVPDRIFFEGEYQSHLLGLMKLAKETAPTEEMKEKAALFAARKTFNDDSHVAKVLSGIKGVLNGRIKQGSKGLSWGLGDWVIKFPRVPGNLISRGLEYSPASILRVLYHIGSAAVEAHQEGGGFKKALASHQSHIANAMAEGIVGTGTTMVLGMLLRSLGLLTGQPDDDKDKVAFMRTQGLGEYKINLSGIYRFVVSGFNPEAARLRQGDVLGTYDWAQPLALGITMGANMYDNSQKPVPSSSGFTGALNTLVSGAGAFTVSLSAGVQTIVDMPLFQGIRNLFGSSQNGTITDSIAKMVMSVPGTFVPTLVKRIRDYIDNTSRSTYDPNAIQAAINVIINKIPGWHTSLPVYFDTLGNAKDTYQAGNNFINVFFNPMLMSKFKPSPEALLVINTMGTDTSVVPRDAWGSKTFSITQDGRKYTYQLSGDEFSRLQQVMGSVTQQLFAQISPDIPDLDRVKLMNDALTVAGRMAKQTVINERGANQPTPTVEAQVRDPLTGN